MDRQKKLNKIAKEIENCKICKVGKSGKAVPGEGNSNAKIMFVGEAPGKNEAKVGRPFIGRSGKLLRSFITLYLGLKEEDVFIVSPVKYLPDRGTPSTDDIKHGMIHLEEQIEIISPKIIVLLGRVAVEGVLGLKIPVLKRHGEIIESPSTSHSAVSSDRIGSGSASRKYFLTLHPAAVLRFPTKFKKIFGEDFKTLKSIL